MRNAASKPMWAGRALAFALAIGAAFPGANGKIVFSSNHNRVGGVGYEIYVVNSDGTGLTQLTTSNSFI